MSMYMYMTTGCTENGFCGGYAAHLDTRIALFGVFAAPDNAHIRALVHLDKERGKCDWHATKQRNLLELHVYVNPIFIMLA